MTINEIKRTETVEKVIRIEYVANDGKVFYSKEECEKYEESALYVVSSLLKRLNTKPLSVMDLFDEGSEEDDAEIFDIQTENDLKNLKQYLYLSLSSHHCSERSIKELLDDDDKYNRRFKGITYGHEVIICWSYDHDWFWTFGDGSFNGYCEEMRKKFIKATTKENDNA